ELEANPAADVSPPKMKKLLPQMLDADLVSRLLMIAGEEPVTRRDHAMMELFYSSGLRLAELCSLDVDDAPMIRTGEVRVKGKGSKERVVPVGRYARAALDRWLPV